MIRSTLPALAALALLAGCGGGTTPAAGTAPNAMAAASAGPPACPRVAVLAEGAEMTRYRAGARPGPRAVEVQARLTGVQSRCELAPRNAGLDLTVVVQAEAERGPALAGGAVELPYFIAVTDGAEGRVLNRGSDVLSLRFSGAERRAAAGGEEMMVRIPGDVRRAAERVVLVSFQLTPEQLEANRRR